MDKDSLVAGLAKTFGGSVTLKADQNNNQQNGQHQSEPAPEPPAEKSGRAAPARRKNSSMTPVVPDLEMMAKLRQEDEESERNKPGQVESATPVADVDASGQSKSTGGD